MAGRRRLRPASPNFPQTWLAAAQRRQPLSTLTGDQGFQSGVNDSSLLRDTAEPRRLLEEVIINVQSCPHMYQYASFMHTVSRGRKSVHFPQGPELATSSTRRRNSICGKAATKLLRKVLKPSPWARFIFRDLGDADIGR